MTSLPTSIDDTLALLSGAGYVADRSLATVSFCRSGSADRCFSKARRASARPRSPRSYRAALGRQLIRLQCYEGLDVASAVYEWNYAGQMMAIRLAEAGRAGGPRALESDLFSSRYLVRRPLLEALEPRGRAPDPPHRRARPGRRGVRGVPARDPVRLPGDDPGTRRHPGRRAALVVVTSNRTREIHDALKRRCLYHWVDYPDAARELAILRARLPDAPERLSRESRALRGRDPGARVVQGARRRRDARLGDALVELDAVALDPASSRTRLACC
jgi:hypothetical protein